MELTGSQIVVEMLKDEGVDTIFGYPGGQIIDFFDELYRHPELNLILVRHEQGAAHMADAYSRTSGKTGVCIVTSGPGATNTVTGIASAYADSVPMVVITGQVSTSLIGNDAFQEVDIVGITRPCTKHNYLVKSVQELPGVIKEAFYLARAGRPGPVLIDLPKDVQKAVTTFVKPGPVKLRAYNPNYKPNKKQLQKAMELILKAERPVIIAGGGTICSKSSEDLREFARNLQIPTTATLMGLGAFPASDPLWLGMLGMHGTYRANMATNHSDLLISVGVRFDDRVTGRTDSFCRQADIIHIDIDPSSIRKNVQVTVPIVGDAKLTLKELNQLLEKAPANKAELTNMRAPWLERIAAWKATTPLAYIQGDEIIKPQYVIEKLHDLSDGKAIITTEVGQHQMWTMQHYGFDEPNHCISSGGLGVMGFGLPAALGAQVAQPNKLVIDIAGDGSIQMNMQEMSTAVQYGLPIKVAILNNGHLGMVRQWQELFYGKRYSSTVLQATPDFVKMAEAFGAVGLRATKPSEVEAVIKQAFNTPGPVIMEFMVEPEENVYPMVPPAGANTDMLLLAN